MDEHIRLVRLTKEDIACFQALDPFERLRFLSLPQGFAIGAVYEDGDISETVGLLSGTASSEMLTIEWLVVSPGYRYREIGESLLAQTFKMAKAGNIETLSAVLLHLHRSAFPDHYWNISSKDLLQIQPPDYTPVPLNQEIFHRSRIEKQSLPMLL